MQTGVQPSLLYRIEKHVLHARRHVLVEHQEAAGEEEQEAGQHSTGAGCEPVYRQAQCEGRAAGKELQGEWSEGHQGRGGQPGDFEKQVKVQDLAALQYSWRFWSSEAAAVAERMLDPSSGTSKRSVCVCHCSLLALQRCWMGSGTGLEQGVCRGTCGMNALKIQSNPSREL